jgi:Uma2 family endonuclease
MAVEATKRYITVDDYYRMAEAGILAEDERVELVEGEITRMSPVGVRHASCVKRLVAFFTQKLGQSMIVGVQDPIRLNIYSEPQPDVALLRPRDDFYATAHPSPADTFIVIEVADSSIGFDRQTKVPLYARAGIPEVWLVDLVNETVTQYVEPIGGEYKQQHQVKRGDHIIASAVRDLTITVDDILGPEAAISSTNQPG